MQNSTVNLAGVKTYTYGQPPTSTSSVGKRVTKTVAVVNGNLQGNFKDPNPFAFTITTIAVQSAFMYVRNRGYPGQEWSGNTETIWGSCDNFGFPLLGLVGPTVLRDRALAKIYDQIRGNSNLATDLAESGQTIHMLRKALNVQRGFVSIVDLLVERFDVSRRRQKRRSRTVNGRQYRKVKGAWIPVTPTGPTLGQQRLDYVTGKWLEYRYGWMPLVCSLYDAYDNLMRSQASEVREIVARSGESNRLDTTKHLVGTYKSHPVKVSEQLSERIRLVYKFAIPDKGIWDWTSLNPAAIAWELMPLSFVADWFMTIGQSLENIENWWLWKTSFAGGYETYTYTCSQTLKADSEWRPVLPPQTGQVELEQARYSGERSRIHKKRSIVTSLPIPGRPRWKIRLGSKQMLDTAALLHQFIGKRFR